MKSNKKKVLIIILALVERCTISGGSFNDDKSDGNAGVGVGDMSAGNAGVGDMSAGNAGVGVENTENVSD